MDKKKAKEFGGSEPFNRMKKDLMKEVLLPKFPEIACLFHQNILWVENLIMGPDMHVCLRMCVQKAHVIAVNV